MNQTQLRHKLRELIAMWHEVAALDLMDKDTRGNAAVRRDCAHDLEDILNGDFSCIERIEA